MSETLENLDNAIEDLRMFQQNTSSQKEYDRYQEIIDTLNYVYNTLVLIGE